MVGIITYSLFYIVYYLIGRFDVLLLLRYYSLFDERVDVIFEYKNKTPKLMSYLCYGVVILFLNKCNIDHSDLID